VLFIQGIVMNYQKLDAALAMALNDVQDPEEPSLIVFIHTKEAPDADAIPSWMVANGIALPENLGVNDVSSANDIFTATLSANAISQLSEEPWVKYIKLSQKLRLLNQVREIQ
jgi:hypothetical protein